MGRTSRQQREREQQQVGSFVDPESRPYLHRGGAAVGSSGVQASNPRLLRMRQGDNNAPLPPGAPPPLPPAGAPGDPRSRLSKKVPSFLTKHRLSARFRGFSMEGLRHGGNHGGDMEDGEGDHDRHHGGLHVHMPHMHLPHMPHLFHHGENHEFEYAFEEEGASSDEEDMEEAESVSLASSAQGGKGGTVVRKIKGGIIGAGAAATHRVNDRKYCQRAGLALFAVCLLWITSYGVARAIVRRYISTPDLDLVASRNAIAFDAAVDTNDRYVKCVNIVADECQRDYDTELAAELARRDTVKAANQAELTRLATTLQLAEDLFSQTQLELDTFPPDVSSGSPALTNSTEPECQLIASIVAGETAAINTLTEARAFQQQSEEQVLNRAQQIERRRRYDEEYLANKTADLQALGVSMRSHVKDMNETFTQVKDNGVSFKDCLVVGGNCPTVPAFTKLETMFNDAISVFDTLKTRAADYKANAEIQLDEYKTSVDTFNGNFATINNAFGGSLTRRDSADADKPFLDLNAFGIVVGPGGIQTPAEVVGGFDGKFDAFVSGLDARAGPFVDNAEDLADNSEGWEAGWDSDYNPPAIVNEGDPNATRDDFAAATSGFIPGLATTLQLVDDTTQDDQAAISDSVDNSTTSLETSSQELFVTLTNHSRWDWYSYGDGVYEQVSTGITDMSDLILVFDIVFRVLRTFLIINKYWSLTGLATPPGDARIKADYGAGWGPKKTPIQKLVAIATNPIVITMLTVATIGTLLAVFWIGYSPLYFEYVDSCVKVDSHNDIPALATGTMLYRNGLEAMTQFAASDGDALAQARIDDLNVGRDLVCSQQGFDDVVLYNNMVDRFNELADRYSLVVAQNAAIEECLDTDFIDNDTNSTSLTLKVTDPAFDQVFTPLSNLAIFDCTAVSGCDAIRAPEGSNSSNADVCTGPNAEQLSSTMHVAACTTENWFHAYLFGTFMVVSVFILMNISRIIVSRALVRTLWRWVVVKNFSFLASVTDRGLIVYPERVTEKGDSMKEAIRISVKKRLRSWERWGWILLAWGLALNAPWIWGLNWLSQNLDYEA